MKYERRAASAGSAAAISFKTVEKDQAQGNTLSGKRIEEKKMFALLFVHLFGSCTGQRSFSTDHGTFTFGLPGEPRDGDQSIHVTPPLFFYAVL